MSAPDLSAQMAASFAEGIRLYNAQQFFEAHEAWESCWLKSEGRERMFYHGLIQAAAAHVHLQRNQRKGAQLLYQKAHDKLQHFHGEYLGLQIGRLNDALAHLFREILDAPPETPIDGAPFLARTPRIEWTPVPVAPGVAEIAPSVPTGTRAFLNDDSARGPAGK